MNVLSLAIAYLRERSLATVLSALLLAVGVATIAALLSFDHQFRERLTRDARGIDLVVGAKGSPLQLVLSAVYHADVPTGNITAGDAGLLTNHPMVRTAIPLALGDSAGGFRFVGTSHALPTHYGATLAVGRLWKDPFEVVPGASAARSLGLELGAEVESAHGLEIGGPIHADKRYTVTGILEPTGTVLDRLLLTSVESIWEIHESGGKAGSGEKHREITALLLKLKSPIAVVRLPPMINQQTTMMAASPAFETARLFALIGSGLDVLRGFGALLVTSAALGVFVSLTSALERRRHDLAILRALGARRTWVAGILVLEALILTAAGAFIGLALAHGTLAALGSLLPEARNMGLSGGVFAPAEFWILPGTVLVGLFAAALPAIRAYRTDVARTLSLG